VKETRFPGLFIDNGVGFNMVTHGRTLCPPGWVLGPRIIQDHLIYYLEKGVFESRLNGKRVRIEKERLFWMQPGVEHLFRVEGSSPEVRVLYFRFFIGKENAVRLSEDFRISDCLPEIHPSLQELLPAHLENLSFGETFLRCQMGQLCCRLLSEGRPATGTEKGLGSIQRKKALSFIEERLESRFTLDALASQAGLHPDYFSRRFKESFGMPPQEWIKRERIRRACSYLLESGLSVTEIAYKLGYDDIYFFSRQFKEVMGQSPVGWRKKGSTAPGA